MASGSVLKPFQAQSTVIKQTDVLVQRLLNFHQTHPNNHPPASSTSAVVQVHQLQRDDELDRALSDLSIDGLQHDRSQVDSKPNKLIRSRPYELPASGDQKLVSVRSWTMTEHIYRREPCPFPTMARGLFTREDVHPDRKLGQGRHQIVVRGYDKFFNIDELPSTKWDALKNRTKPPYHLTLKTNGCIIFMAALTPDDLLVTSKHATGGSDPELQDQPLTHSAVGELWVKRHLTKAGITSAQLAKELWEANATAVAELTDDDFEEHVIATPLNEIGLNLHGINLNTPELLTYPPDVVAQCAKRWGMHPTPFTTVHDIEAVKEYCQKVQSEGWEGRSGHVEGVVVRGTPRDASPVVDPTAPAASIFWKVKFEEPYLMYREWRELTRKMLHELKSNEAAFNQHRPSRSAPISLTPSESEELAKLLKVNVKKIHKLETRLYVHWVLQELSNRPESFELWQKNRGIIASREAFFSWRESKLAQTIIDQLSPSKSAIPNLESHASRREEKFDKVLLVPIGVPGCGKTTLAVALQSLIGCEHTQSDDITTKKTGPAFIENVKNLLIQESGSKVVIADKNNHLKSHREALIDLTSKLKDGIEIKMDKGKGKGKGSKGSRETKTIRLNIRLIAITWDLDRHPTSVLHEIASQRVVKRGENHQSLRPELTVGGLEAHETILWRFLKTYEEFDQQINQEDRGFDEVIELKFEDSIESNLITLCTRLQELIPPDQLMIDRDRVLLDHPSRIQKALRVAEAYKPRIKKDMKLDSTLLNPRYFGIKLDDVELSSLIKHAFERLMINDGGGDDKLTQKAEKEEKENREAKMIQEAMMFLETLRRDHRIISIPHITLVHQNQVAGVKKEAPVDNKDDDDDHSHHDDPDHERMKALWEHCKSLVLKNHHHPSQIRLQLGPKLIWDDRVMVIEARLVDDDDLEPTMARLLHPPHPHHGPSSPSFTPSSDTTSPVGPLPGSTSATSQEADDGRPEADVTSKADGVNGNPTSSRRILNQRYHVTIGTVDESIRPIEGLHLLNRFFDPHQPSSHEQKLNPHPLRHLHLHPPIFVLGSIKGLS